MDWCRVTQCHERTWEGRGSQEAEGRGGMAQAGARSLSLTPRPQAAWLGWTPPPSGLTWPSPATQMSCPGPLGASGVTEVPQLAMVHARP